MSLADKIKAATAYCLGLNKNWRPDDSNTFPWAIGAFRALCDIKANAKAARGLRWIPPRTIIETVLLRS